MPKSIPNILTVTRMLLTPLLVICLLKEMYMYSLLLFTIAGVSDGLDGFLARTLDSRTKLGAYLDPLADKILLVTAFLSLAYLKHLPMWLTVVVIARDILIVLGIAVCPLWHIHVAIRPSLISKATTFFQIALVFFVLLHTGYPYFSRLNGGLYWITASVTILSGLHYLYLGLNLLQRSEDERDGDERSP